MEFRKIKGTLSKELFTTIEIISIDLMRVAEFLESMLQIYTKHLSGKDVFFSTSKLYKTE